MVNSHVQCYGSIERVPRSNTVIWKHNEQQTPPWKSGGGVCSNESIKQNPAYPPASTLVSCSDDFRPWRWKWHMPPKHQFIYGLHDGTSQMVTAFLVTVHSVKRQRNINTTNADASDINGNSRIDKHWYPWLLIIMRTKAGNKSNELELPRILVHFWEQEPGMCPVPTPHTTLVCFLGKRYISLRQSDVT
jgi:hypothetical protein